MDKNLNNTIEKKLKKLNSEQVVSFAWRCAVRAFPFIAGKNGFDFWEEGKRQKHLFNILYALV